MTQILELAREAGVATFPTYQDGNSILVYGGKRIVYGAEDPHSLSIPVPEADVKDFMGAVTEMAKLSREVPSQAPWEAPRAREFDYQTVESWMQQNLATDGAKFALRSVVAGYFAVEPCDLHIWLCAVLVVASDSGWRRRAR